MVRVPHYQLAREQDLDATMTPMIDVVFLLLIFFVWTSGTQMIEYILPSQLLAQQGNVASQATDPLPEQDFDSVVIRLRYDGTLPDWTINDQPMNSVGQVSNTLDTLAKINIDAPIIVHPDENVPLGYVIEIYDVSKLAGFDKVSFAVNTKLQN